MRARALVMVAAALLAASCTSDEPAARAPAPGTKPGGTLVVGITKPTSIDPATAYEPDGLLVVRTMCDQLFQHDAQSGRLALGLAKSTQALPDGMGLTIALRKGARFSDGTPITSKDISYALSRVASDQTASPFAARMRNVAGYEAVHGDDPKVGDADQARSVLIGVQSLSGSSFTISLQRADPELADLLAQTFTTPVPRGLAERSPQAFARQPVCSGPYRMTRPWADADTTIELVRTKGHEPGNDGFTSRGAGYPERVVFRIFPDRAAVVRAYAAREIDVANVGQAPLDSVRPFGDDLVAAASPGVEYIAVPTGLTALDHPAARRALSLALDRRQIAAEVYGGTRLPADSVLPPTVGGRAKDACAAAVPATAYAQAAKALLAVANPAPPPPMRLYVNDEPGTANRRLADAVAAQWKANLGITTEVLAIPWDALLNRATGSDGVDGAFRASWSSPVPSPTSYLAPLFGSTAIGSTNLTRYSDRAFDLTLATKVLTETDAAVRRRQEQSLEEQVCTTLPLIPVTFGMHHALVRKERVGSAAGAFSSLSTGELAIRELFVR